MKFRAVFVFPALLLLGVLFVSCTDVMSSSWGAWAKRDPKIPSITSGNIQGLLKAAVGDPEFAKALLDKITASAQSASGERKKMLEGAGISAAALASGLDTLILNGAGSLISSGDVDANALQNTMESIFKQAWGTNQTAIADELVVLLAQEDLSNPNPGILAYTETDKLIISAMVLLIADSQKAGSGSFGEYLDTFADTQVNDPGSLSEYQKTALCLGAIVADTEGIGDLFDFLKLGS
ncbi:MAG: hypothetical protein LBP23_01045 [Treponema sp.]|jgi:hypothetical protein|nr:hypothetical protein [Treponema sp.]